MRLLINGKEQHVEASTVSEVLSKLELDDAVVATAVNGSFVPAGLRATTPLGEGDAIEIVAPMQGG